MHGGSKLPRRCRDSLTSLTVVTRRFHSEPVNGRVPCIVILKDWKRKHGAHAQTLSARMDHKVDVYEGFVRKSPTNLSRFYHTSLFCYIDLKLRCRPRCLHLSENKLAEACASRTHRRHQRCRPPVLKTGGITGPRALPVEFSQRSPVPTDALLRLCNHSQIGFQCLPATRKLLFGLLLGYRGRNDDVISGLPVHWSCHIMLRG